MMRKFRLILLGIVIGVATSIPLQVAAESLSKIGKQVEVEVPVRVNGQLLDTLAIGIEGTTYTPVRSLAESLDAAVDWDGETGEVVIQTTAGDEKETPTNEGDSVEITRVISKTVEAIDQEISLLNLRNEILKEEITLYGGQEGNSTELEDIIKDNEARMAELKDNEARIVELEATKAKLLEAHKQ